MMSEDSKHRVRLANRLDEVIALLDAAKMGCYRNDEASVIVNVTKAGSALREVDDLLSPSESDVNGETEV